MTKYDSRIALMVLLVACIGGCGPEEIMPSPIDPRPTLDEFAQAHRGPTEGTYVVEGDIFLSDRQELEAYFYNRDETDDEVSDENSGTHLKSHRSKLLINRLDGCKLNEPGRCRDRWSEDQKQNLSYCVSKNFERYGKGTYETVVNAMNNATRDWSDGVNIKFTRDDSTEQECKPAKDATNKVYRFAIRPAELDEIPDYALSFFPSDEPRNWNLIIQWDLVDDEIKKKRMTAEGLMLHELGHILGFRHEILRHIHRNEEGTRIIMGSEYSSEATDESRSRKGIDWESVRANQSFDYASVMSYRTPSPLWEQWYGIEGQQTTYNLSADDRADAAIVYGSVSTTPAN